MFYPFFFLRSNNKHCPHQCRCGNSLKLRFGSGENSFPECGFLGKTARCPTPETAGPYPPSPPAAPAEAAPPAPPAALSAPADPIPPPRPAPAPAPPPLRARPAEAAQPAGRGGGARARNEAGSDPGRAHGRVPQSPAAAWPEPHLPTPYFSSSVGVHMAGPGAAPQAQRPGNSAAGTAAGPAVAHREPRRGRSGGAGQWAAHPSQAARDAAAAATSGPRGSAGGPVVPGGLGSGLPLVRRHRSRTAARSLTAPMLGSRRRRGSARLSWLAGRPRMRHSPARGGSRCPGSRRPSPRASPRAAAARQRREICEKRLDGQAEVSTDSSADPEPLATASARGGEPGRWDAVGSHGFHVQCLLPGTPRSPRGPWPAEESAEGRK